MLRIHFTAADMAKTRVSTGNRPLLELDIAARILQEPCASLRLRAWRSTASRRLRELPRARRLLQLIPPGAAAPAFLLPTRAAGTEDLLESVRATPRRIVDRDLAAFATHQQLPGWARQLSAVDGAAKSLADDLAELHQALLGPDWNHVRLTMDADRALRSRQLLEGGVERLLAGVNPQYVRWTAPVLEVRLASGRDFDLHLDGHGLALAPSVFGVRVPYLDLDVLPQPILVYPAHRAGTVLFAPAGGGPTRKALAALLGSTRAAVLESIATRPRCTTGELARALDIAPATASEHATVLRDARLITTERYRTMALHSPTPTGLALLNDTYSDDHAT